VVKVILSISSEAPFEYHEFPEGRQEDPADVTPAYPQWPGFPIPFGGRRSQPARPVAPDAPDHHSQLEELLGHVRRCERWAALDDRIDLWLQRERGI
jgi:hypothetical protein